MNQMRDRVVDQIGKASGLDAVTCRAIETGTYNWAIRYSKLHNIQRTWADAAFTRCYARKALSIANNLDPQAYVGNERLRQRIADVEFPAHELASMKPENVLPELWNSKAEALALRDEKELKSKLVAKSNRFRCKRCGHNETSFYEMQIRSGDEGSTLFISCLNCGTRWRSGG
jgi:DNA-directed RNA polymerase subunit M/transcription elongation factor TFIIS